jgi:hypothetical protein
MRDNKKIHDRRKWKKPFPSFSLKLIKNNQSTYKLLRFDFRHLQNSEVGLPLMEPIQGIIVCAEILRQRLPLNRSFEHPAQCHPLDYSALNSKPDDSPRELVHRNQNPMCSQGERFTAKKVDAP